MEILPCPFCGSDDVHIDQYNHLNINVTCDNCHMCGPMCRDDLRELAVERWNSLPRKADVKRLERESDWLAETIEKIVYMSYDYIRAPESEEWCERLIELSLGDDEIDWREAASIAVEKQK